MPRATTGLRGGEKPGDKVARAALRGVSRCYRSPRWTRCRTEDLRRLSASGCTGAFDLGPTVLAAVDPNRASGSLARLPRAPMVGGESVGTPPDPS